MEGFSIKLESFEGPLGVLLSMVEKHKVHPSDIPLSKITDEYIAFVKESDIRPEEIAEFILVAATLMLIKSRSLLPRLSLTRSEEASIEELEARVSEYQKIKTLAAHLKERLQGSGFSLRKGARPGRDGVAPGYRPPVGTPISLTILCDTVKKVVAGFPIKSEIPQTTVKKIRSLEEVLSRLLARVTEQLKTDLHSFAGKERESIILTFLAILELARQGTISVSQRDQFGSIEVETRSYGIPSYL